MKWDEKKGEKRKKSKGVPCETAHPELRSSRSTLQTTAERPRVAAGAGGERAGRDFGLSRECSAIGAFCTARDSHLLAPSFLREFVKAVRISSRKLFLNACTPKGFTSFQFGSTTLHYFSGLQEFPLKNARTISLVAPFLLLFWFWFSCGGVL